MILATPLALQPMTQADQRAYWVELAECLHQLGAVLDLRDGRPELLTTGNDEVDLFRSNGLACLDSAVLWASAAVRDRLAELSRGG